MPDDDVTGIDLGDLPEALDRIAASQEGQDDLQDRRLPLEEHHEGFCLHGRVFINGQMRKLTCRHCGAELDPFDFLLRLSRETTRWVQARKDVEQRYRAAKARLEELTRLERNTRNRLKRLQSKETNQ